MNKNILTDVIVIGGGAAGMFAAIIAAKNGNTVCIVEKTSDLGNKLKITGKGRCNVTFSGTEEDFKNNIVKNYKFMYSSFANFNNNDVVKYFANLGIMTKVERGGRVFPVSDKAEDVVFALKKEIKKNNINVILSSQVSEIIVHDKRVQGIKLENGKTLNCKKCILATGGMSYKTTGSTGDGYNIAKKLGHNIVKIVPGLVPIKTYSNITEQLQGLSLKNVGIKILEKDKLIYTDFGEMLFTHFGVSGPIILSASSKINRLDNLKQKLSNKEIILSVDLKPSLSEDTLDKRVCRDFEKYANKEFKNSLDDLLPKKLIPVVIKKSNIDESKKVNQITKEERKNIVKLLKSFDFHIKDLMPIDLAVISSGGIDVKEINPKTMESKLIQGLYFAGEIIDVDAYTGGFNLQIAFSTAYTAGKNV